MTDDIITRQYAVRDHIAQGKHYVRHVSAMTGEGLHAKSAIAAELAHRDIEIERLRAAAQQARAALSDAEHALTKARIWGGMEWHYNPLHPMFYVPALEKLQAALKETP